MIISNGVFHKIGDISQVVEKAVVHQKAGGLICFTVIPHQPDTDEGLVKNSIPGIYSFLNEEINLSNYLSEKPNYDYTFPANLFSEVKCIIAT